MVAKKSRKDGHLRHLKPSSAHTLHNEHGGSKHLKRQGEIGSLYTGMRMEQMVTVLAWRK